MLRSIRLKSTIEVLSIRPGCIVRMALMSWLATGSVSCDSQAVLGRGVGGSAPLPDAAGQAPTPASCNPDAGALVGSDPAQRRVVTGTNGTLTDLCDAAGNLVKAMCTEANICGSGINPICRQTQTGGVEAQAIDCAGLCVAGACASGCPELGDVLTVTSTNGAGAIGFSNRRDQRHYACTFIFQPAGGADCATALIVGDTQRVTSLGLHGIYCPGVAFGNLGTTLTANTEACTFACDIAP